MDPIHQGHKEQSPLSPEQGSAFSLIPPPPPPAPCTHPTLITALTSTMRFAEAKGNKDNYIKQPFEIPLGFGCAGPSGLGDVGGLMHCFSSVNGRNDITMLRS